MTVIYKFIAQHGLRVTERRAMRDERYADRQKLRRTSGGTVRFLDDHFTMEMWEEETGHWSDCRPWWFRVSQHVHWWMEEHGPRATIFNIKCFWQRGRRGFSDRDIWGFDHYLSTVIRDGVSELNRIKHGWPGEPLTFEDWTRILQEISDGMQAHLDLNDLAEEKDLVAQRDLAFDHLKTYWEHLWD